MPLTAENIAIVQATAPVVAEHALEITTLFYKTMFENNPEVLAFFNKSHQKEGRQPRALADAVVAYAVHIQELDKLGPLVARMAHRHVALSVKPEHYAIVHKNLMIAIGKVLGDAVTEEIAKGWSESVLALAEICIGAEENLYKENEARQGGWRYEREFKLISKTKAGKDCIIFEFAPTDGYIGGFEFNAGQYLTIRCDGLKAAPRHYTLISKSGDKTLKICTRKVSGGQMSTYMHEKMNVGDTCRLGSPCGVFVADDSKDAVLISAGIGITPMVSFLQKLGPNKVKAALHVESDASRDALSSTYKLSGVQEVTINYSNESGRIKMNDQASKLVSKSGLGAAYYICGPNEFMSQMKAALESQGCTDIRTEVFGTGTVSTNKSAEDANKSFLSSIIKQPVSPLLAAGVVAAGAAFIVGVYFARNHNKE